MEPIKKNLKFVSLLIVMCSFAFTFNANAGMVHNHYKKINSTIDWIYAPNHSRRPTNRLGWFYGNQLNFWHSRRSPTNGADRSFGYLLYYTYDYYCLKKFKRKNCLGKSLRVNYRINGSSKAGFKTMQIDLNGQKITSNYFQEVISKFFTALENVGGNAGLNKGELAVIHKKPKSSIRADFHVLVPTSGANLNNKWQKKNFNQRVLNDAKKVMFNLLPFEVGQIASIKNDRDYKDDSQGDILRKYDRSVQKRGAISAVISGPHTKDSVGRAYLRRSSTPSFVMRSRYNGPKNQYSKQAVRNNALVYIHELAHNLLNLGHCSKGQKSMCTDNLWSNKSHANHVLKRLREVNLVGYQYDY